MIETEARVYFAIKTEDSTIEESTISSFIPLKPTRFSKMNSKGNTPKCSIWEIASEKIKNPDISRMIEEHLTLLFQYKYNLIDFKNKYPEVGYIFEIVIYHGDHAEGFCFSNNQLHFLYEIGAGIDVDQYNYKD